MKNQRAFTVRFLSATDTKGARVAITESHNGKTYRKVLPYNYSFNTARQTAANYLEGLGLNLVGYGETNCGCVIMCDSWGNGNGLTNILGDTEN